MVTVKVKFLLSSGEASGIIAHTFRKSLLEGIHIMYRVKTIGPREVAQTLCTLLYQVCFRKLEKLSDTAPPLQHRPSDKHFS